MKSRPVRRALIFTAGLIATMVLVLACAAEDEAHLRAMAREHAADEPVASPATAVEPRAEVVAETVRYATLADGENTTAVSGYFARPAGGGTGQGGIILIHEWWGLNDNIRAVADRFAGEGYLALAVDLYEGSLAQDRDGAAALMRATLDKTDRLNDNLRQARDYLARAGAGRIGSVGWCFGGGWSLNAAIHLGGDLDAAVIYYGRVTDDRERLSLVEAPILGLFGGQDRGIPVDSVRAFEVALGELGKPVTIHIYEDANHAFANPSGTRYDQSAARDAWAKTLAFFGEHLE